MSSNGDEHKSSYIKLKSALEKIEALKEELARVRSSAAIVTLQTLRESSETPLPDFSVCRELMGHKMKIYCTAWSWNDDYVLASASQDRKLIIWDTMTTDILNCIDVGSAWTMTCAFEPSRGEHIGVGGLDNVFDLYHTKNMGNDTPIRSLKAHDGYISCCRFISDHNVITSSGDCSCVLWDTTRQNAIGRFRGHESDVMGVSLCPTNNNLFISGSVDRTAKMWDVRQQQCTHTFTGHAADLNAVEFLPNGCSFLSASDDGTCRIFDVRAYGTLGVFRAIDRSGVLTVAPSRYGPYHSTPLCTPVH